MNAYKCKCGGIAEHVLNEKGELTSMVKCPHCEAEWYVNHCWNCGEIIDGRNTSRCEKCHWYICPACNSCSEKCASGNIY